MTRLGESEGSSNTRGAIYSTTAVMSYPGQRIVEWDDPLGGWRECVYGRGWPSPNEAVLYCIARQEDTSELFSCRRPAVAAPRAETLRVQALPLTSQTMVAGFIGGYIE
jgi:hypothetical protein